MSIKFNKPYIVGNELNNISKVIENGHFRGNGEFTKLCQDFFEEKYGFKKCFLTNSCTDALEMSGLLIDVNPGDEVIVPSYGYYSTANAFLLRGAKIIFAESLPNHPNISVQSIEELITPRTKAIIVIHYSGIACEMEKIMDVANKNNIWVIEDAAQAIEAKHNNKYLGTFGHLSTFSFHETKNIHSGEGGMLCINDASLIENAKFIWEKGTNKLAFENGEVEKYSWKSVGSSYSPNDYTAAFLHSQFLSIDSITNKRKVIWNFYSDHLNQINREKSIIIGNAHSFYIICKNEDERNEFQQEMKRKNIEVSIHYQSLHKNDFLDTNTSKCPNAELFSNQLIRLPFHLFLSSEDLTRITEEVQLFFKKK